MKLTKPQQAFLQSIRRNFWTEMGPDDKTSTVLALERKGLLETYRLNKSVFRFRMTEKGIETVRGGSKANDELLQAIKGKIQKICRIYPSVGQAMSEEPLTRLALAITETVETKFLNKTGDE